MGYRFSVLEPLVGDGRHWLELGYGPSPIIRKADGEVSIIDQRAEVEKTEVLLNRSSRTERNRKAQTSYQSNSISTMILKA